MWVAAQNGHVRAVELLIAAKAGVDIQQKVRFTACVYNYYDLYTRHFLSQQMLASVGQEILN